MAILVKDLKSKQDNVDSYIDEKSNAKTSAAKKKLNAKYKLKQSELEEKVSKFKTFTIAAIIGMAVAVVSAFTGIKTLLLLIVVDAIISICLIFKGKG